MRNFILRSTGDLGNMLFEWALLRRLAGDQPSSFYWDPVGMKECELERIGLPIRRMPSSMRSLTPISSRCGLGRRIVYPFTRRMGFTLPIVSDTYSESYSRKQEYNYPSGAFVQGRFQDCSQVSEATRSEVMKAVEAQLLEKKLVPANVLGVHIRRGDYMDEYWKSRLGLLSQEYFESALQQVAAKYEEVRIFTDSPDNDVVKRLAEKWGGKISNNSSRYEDMWEMSQCSSLIISNSTFSLWAALLGKNIIQEVLVPDPWVIQDASPDLNFPPNWKWISSVWS